MLEWITFVSSSQSDSQVQVKSYLWVKAERCGGKVYGGGTAPFILVNNTSASPPQFGTAFDGKPFPDLQKSGKVQIYSSCCSLIDWSMKTYFFKGNKWFLKGSFSTKILLGEEKEINIDWVPSICQEYMNSKSILECGIIILTLQVRKQTQRSDFLKGTCVRIRILDSLTPKPSLLLANLYYTWCL